MTEETKKEKQPNEVLEVGKATSALVERANAEALNFMNPKTWEMMKVMSQTFLQAGALPKGIDTAPKLIMILQAGNESGLKPLEALSSFYIVNGKISMYGEIAISQVRKAGHRIAWGKCNDDEATITITRGDTGEKMSNTFTMAMATERGLTSKGGPWKSAPDNMLKFKAFWSVARFLVPDALHGVSIKEVEETEGEPVVVNAKVLPVEKEKKVEDVQEGVLDNTEKSLEEALEKEEDNVHVPGLKEEDKPKEKKVSKKATKSKEKKEIEKTVKKEEAKKESSAAKAMREAREAQVMGTDEEKYNILIEKELAGSKLTKEDIAFCDEYTKK